MVYYLAAAGIFITLKFWYAGTANENLFFLLQPTDKIISLVTGTSSVYSPENGFYHDQLNIMIERSCSGFNFLILSFLVFTCLLIKHFKRMSSRIIVFPAVMVCVYLFTIFVNSSRILVSVIVQKEAGNFFPDRPHHLIHEVIGIVTNLTFLVLTYLLAQKILKQKQKNEKPA